VVKYLLEHGAKTDVVDDMGRSPIDLVAGARGGREDTRSKDIAALLQKVSSTQP
jgi:hypothetical protein